MWIGALALIVASEALLPSMPADRFVLNRLKIAADTGSDKAGRAYQAATAARMSYMDAKELDPHNSSDPEYLALLDAEDKASTALILINSQIYRIADYNGPLSGGRPQPDPGVPFVHFAAPIPLFEEAKTQPIFGPPITGPRAAFSMAGAVRKLWQAASGQRRAPSAHTALQHCVMLPAWAQDAPGAIVSGTRLCEVAAVLPIDYDLTGTDCAASSLPIGPIDDLVLPGTRIADGACKETWIYPHLNVIYGTDFFTVHAPLPQGIAPGDSGAPLSQWSAVWNGQEQVLALSATFAWNGSDPVLQDIELVHGVRPQVQYPRIWRDFRVDQGSPLIFALTMPKAGVRHDYTPTRIPASARSSAPRWPP